MKLVRSGSQALLDGFLLAGDTSAEAWITPQMEAFRQGRRVLVQEAQGGPLAGLPNLPKAIDAASTVNYIRAVLGGQLPVPAPIARQVEHILLATSAS